MTGEMTSKHPPRWMMIVCLLGGLVLTIIGVRFLLVPESAARTFGVADPPVGFEMHHVIGVRDIWLGLLAMAFAALRQWRAVTLWSGMGALVCFADAGIVAMSSGILPLVAFHVTSGVICIAVTLYLARFWSNKS